MNMELVHCMVCPFIYSQLSLVLLNQRRRDGMLSWYFYIVAMGRIQSHDIAVRSPVLYNMAVSAPLVVYFLLMFLCYGLCSKIVVAKC